ncbi:DUF222 domain-containing protein [Actinomycetospora lutea]|uniref:HNH endonuclease signature motif containing protein n=1 Tax=Actinomycetospora lutea TaxID=663604 RepID=UPI0023671C65|nr:HNH endonuclease signature motif containing protein [Actinomycetospora lutea]MDD7941669.1 DUF222 domain-containing protein [Actinomycetospora lutea]
MSERVGAVERELLERTRTRLAARNAEHYRLLVEVAELDRQGIADRTGDRLVERLVQDLARCDRAEAVRLVDEARDLVPRPALSGEPLPPRLPHTAEALSAGTISEAHVTVIRRVMRRLAAVEHLEGEVVAEAEHVLAEQARELSPGGLGKAADRLLARLDPDGAAPDPGAGRSDGVQLLRRRDGTLDLRAVIADAAAAAMIDEGFDVMSTPAGPDDPRDLPARRADALKELFAAAHGPDGLITDTRRDGTPDGGGDADSREPDANAPEPDDAQGALIPAPRRPERTSAPAAAGRALLTITIDHRWLRRAGGYGTLTNEALVDVHTVRRWACDAEVIPVVLGSRSEPLDVGRRSRAVTDAIRRALNVRDGGCAFPGCTRRPRRCHAHHVHHWVDGGVTALDNLVLLCSHHHRLLHHGHWRVEMIHGRPWFTPPAWIDLDRRPRIGGRPPPSVPDQAQMPSRS